MTLTERAELLFKETDPWKFAVLSPNIIRELLAENDHLNRMRVHCPDCGGDYLGTGLELGCPCKVYKEIDRLKAENKRLHGDGSHCCCRFEEDGETPIEQCSVHAEMRKQRDRFQRALEDIAEMGYDTSPLINRARDALWRASHEQ
jgi:hypothetical protein